jgi:hypothetical protein
MILLVDDDPRSIRPYCEELDARSVERDRPEWKTELVSDVDKAIRLVRRLVSDTQRKLPSGLELVVFDMMMPVGKVFAQAAHEGGLRTGELFHQALRVELPDVPTLLFTNRNVEQLDGPFRTDPRCVCRMKEELLPGELADYVERSLGGNPRRTRASHRPRART